MPDMQKYRVTVVVEAVKPSDQLDSNVVTRRITDQWVLDRFDDLQEAIDFGNDVSAEFQAQKVTDFFLGKSREQKGSG